MVIIVHLHFFNFVFLAFDCCRFINMYLIVTIIRLSSLCNIDVDWTLRNDLRLLNTLYTDANIKLQDGHHCNVIQLFNN